MTASIPAAFRPVVIASDAAGVTLALADATLPDADAVVPELDVVLVPVAFAAA